ncbi:hypothetical protein GCM10009853_093780 [Glycomyces scopariae]
MHPHAPSPEFQGVAAQAGLGHWQTAYRPRPTRIAVPLTVAGVIYIAVVACLAGSNLLANGFGLIMLAIFTVFIGLGVLNLAHMKRRSGAGDELHFFEHGLIIKGPKTLVSVFHWDDALVYQRLFHYPQTGLTTYNYLLTDDANAPIAIGDPKGAASSALVNLDGDLADFTLGAAFDRPDQWGPAIQSAITNAQLPNVLARITSGEKVRFGRLALTRHALVVEGTTIPWTDLQQITVKDGTAAFKSGGRFFRTREQVYAIPNFFVFKEAVQARSGLTWT